MFGLWAKLLNLSNFYVIVGRL